MSKPFEIGDRIEVVREKLPTLKRGDIFTVTEECAFDDGDWFVWVKDSQWLTSRFRKVKDYQELNGLEVEP